MEWKWPVVKYEHIKLKPRICVLFLFLCLTWTVNVLLSCHLGWMNRRRFCLKKGGSQEDISVITIMFCFNEFAFTVQVKHNKKLSYRRGTARCVVSIEILPFATQQCRNYLYDKSWPNRWYEVGDLVGGNVSWTMCTQHNAIESVWRLPLSEVS